MKIWKSILNYYRENSWFLLICMWCTILLFCVMKSETKFTDAGLSVVTVVIAARSYKKQKADRKLQNGQIMLENYLEKVRYELSGSKRNSGLYGGAEAFESIGLSNQYYYRVFCTLRDVYNTLGCQNNSTAMDEIGNLQETIVKEHDLQKNAGGELSGLKWIILSAIPALPLVRAWVTANISELDSFYSGESGVILKYGIWIFALLVFILFDRLGEIKSEKYT